MPERVRLMAGRRKGAEHNISIQIEDTVRLTEKLALVQRHRFMCVSPTFGIKKISYIIYIYIIKSSNQAEAKRTNCPKL